MKGDFELEFVVFLLQKVHLGNLLERSLFSLFFFLVIVRLDLDGWEARFRFLPSAVSVFVLSLAFVGNDKVQVLSHIVVIDPMGLLSLLQVVHDCAAYLS